VNAYPGQTHTTGNPLTITVDNLSKRFNREWIFRHLSYQFDCGKIYAVTGPNGSGKSTLLQVVWGQVPQSSGAILYRKGESRIAVEETFRHLSIATPYMDLIEEFTLAEMLNFHFKLKKLRGGYTLEDLPSIMYLEDATDKQLINFSSGMRQRVKLGLALYTDADVYFLDEPGTNLDERAFGWYIRELEKLGKNVIVLIASNDPAEYPASATVLNIMDYKKGIPL
jgi:ABC-type multidrug transport system ATPase subunit